MREACHVGHGGTLGGRRGDAGGVREEVAGCAGARGEGLNRLTQLDQGHSTRNATPLQSLRAGRGGVMRIVGRERKVLRWVIMGRGWGRHSGIGGGRY